MANQQDIEGIVNVIKSYMNTLSTICDADQKQEVLLDLANDLFNDVLMPNKPYKGTVWVVYYNNPDQAPSAGIYGVYSSEEAAINAENDLKISLCREGAWHADYETEVHPVLD